MEHSLLVAGTPGADTCLFVRETDNEVFVRPAMPWTRYDLVDHLEALSSTPTP